MNTIHIPLESLAEGFVTESFYRHKMVITDRFYKSVLVTIDSPWCTGVCALAHSMEYIIANHVELSTCNSVVFEASPDIVALPPALQDQPVGDRSNTVAIEDCLGAGGSGSGSVSESPVAPSAVPSDSVSEGNTRDYESEAD